MATKQPGSAAEHLPAAALPPDGQLLESFISRGDRPALEALVRRHGPMVWGVCRRLLDHHDAEDAFQATFLVLVRRAGSIVPRELVGNWLYGVAHQTALKARANLAKLKTRERQVAELPEPQAPEEATCPGLRRVLDEELSRLPDNYRAAVVLCDLEGKTRQEAARHLGLPEGTVASRLARGRGLLADRLSRRGLAVPGCALAGLLAREAVPVPASVLSATITAATTGVGSLAAASLAEGVLNTMFLSKLKAFAAALVVAVCLLGVGALAYQALADKPAKKDGVKGGDKPGKPVKPGAGKKGETVGTVVAVDAAKNTVTLANKARGELTFEVAKDARVFIDDGTGKKTGFREGKLADLAVGAIASLRADGKKASLIHVEGPHVDGMLKAVDARARTITVHAPAPAKKEFVDRTFTVAEGANIWIDDGSGKKGAEAFKLADLKAGTAVSVKLSGDLKSVGSVLSRGHSVLGAFKSAEGGKITVTAHEGKKPGEKTFELAKGVRVLVFGSKGGKAPAEVIRLSELKPGAIVRLQLTLDGKAVASVHAEGEVVRGEFKVADVARRIITVVIRSKGSTEEVRKIEVVKGARVLIDDKEGKLDDLPPECQLTVRLSPLKGLAILVQAAGPGVRGYVKGTAGDGKITIGGKMDDQTYDVGKDVRVVVDGKAGKLSDLIEGTAVSAQLSADKKRLRGIINAQGPSFRGLVKALDDKKITLLVGSKGAVGGEEKDFALTRETAVVTEKYKKARLSDLKTDAEVLLRVTVDQKAARQITILGD